MLFKGGRASLRRVLLMCANAYFVRQICARPRPLIRLHRQRRGSRSRRDSRRTDRDGLHLPWFEGFRTLTGFDFKDRWIRSDGIFKFANFTHPAVANVDKLFHARRQEYAGYFEQEGSFLNGHVLVTGGFRVDGNSQFGEEVSPAWSVAIPLTKISTTLRGSYTEGFPPPAFDELFFPGFGNPICSRRFQASTTAASPPTTASAPR